MNESELRTYCLEHAGEEMTAEAKAFLAQNPELSRQVDRQITVKKLIALKRYEQPSEHSLNRCIAGVDEEIARRRLSPLTILREWIAFEPNAMKLAAAAAALVVCAIGVSVLMTRDAWQAQVADNETPAPVTPVIAPEPVILAESPDIVEDVADDAFFMTAAQKPIIVLRVDSNRQPRPSGMTIGGGQVMPVSFER